MTESAWGSTPASAAALAADDAADDAAVADRYCPDPTGGSHTRRQSADEASRTHMALLLLPLLLPLLLLLL